jgi:hypothetical protein
LSAETQFPQDHLSTLEGCYEGAFSLDQLLHDHAALLGYYSRFGWTLTEKLDDCDGVLKPPTVGDTEMVEPALDVGRTPVIRPDELPEQQQRSEAQ